MASRVPGKVKKHVALLRGINVGKAKRMAMAEFRDLLAGLGYGDVQTLLQSGNAVFTTPRSEPRALERTIKRAITERFGFDVSVIVRSRNDLATSSRTTRSRST